MSWTIIGHESAVKALSGAVEHDRVAHAYLFAGPKHVGKTFAALQFAQLLNCTGEDRPCGRCRQCERIAAGAHADVEMVSISGLCDGEGHDHSSDSSRDIKICQIRRLDRIVSRTPFEGRYRIIVIEPADAMNAPSANALLKTLEEPPPHVVIILVTDREDVLLETIRSRTRRLGFQGLPKALIERALRTRWDVEPERAAELARLAAGRIGWAVRALHDERMLQQRIAALDRAQALASGTLTERFLFAAQLGGGFTRDRAGVHAALEMWQECWRDVLLVAAGREEEAVHRDRLDRVHVLASQCGVGAAARALRAITEARQQLDENASPVLALEAMMLALPELRPNAVSARLGLNRS